MVVVIIIAIMVIMGLAVISPADKPPGGQASRRTGLQEDKPPGGHASRRTGLQEDTPPGRHASRRTGLQGTLLQLIFWPLPPEDTPPEDKPPGGQASRRTSIQAD